MRLGARSTFFATLRAWLSMPLLRKELVEIAARRRTYILRVVYAVALFAVFSISLPQRAFSGSILSYSLLGFGRRLFEQLIIIQCFGVILFQPALMCGRITQEKERDSLVLLFLTELRPWEIILQKYLGGLAPMFSFLLLGLPLAGVAYAFGGLEGRDIVTQVLGLLVLTLQIGAFTLLCSAWCRSTVGALISSYFLGLAFYIGPPLLWNFLEAMHVTLGGVSYFQGYAQRQYSFLFIPQAAFEIARTNVTRRVAFLAPSFLSIGVFLVFARVFLVRRAFVPALNFLPRLFARLDRLMKWANRFLGGVVLYRDTGSLPGAEPIFWRETQRRVLGKTHYLLRLFCLLEIPTVLLCYVVVMGGSSIPWEGLSVAVMILMILALFTLSATAANSLVSERVGQTLEVLLTTPLSAWQIVRQKDRALRRLEWVIAAPLLTLFACKAFLMAGGINRNGEPARWIPYFACGLMFVFIYLPMTTWLSLWIGLRVRTRFQAILTALGTLTVWMAVTPLLIILLDNSRSLGTRESSWIFLASPLGVPLLIETGELSRLGSVDSSWLVIIVNAALYVAIALFFRSRLMHDADRYLRR